MPTSNIKRFFFFRWCQGSISPQLPLSCDETSKQLLNAALKSARRRRKQEVEEVTTSLAAAAVISVDAANVKDVFTLLPTDFGKSLVNLGEVMHG